VCTSGLESARCRREKRGVKTEVKQGAGEEKLSKRYFIAGKHKRRGKY